MIQKVIKKRLEDFHNPIPRDNTQEKEKEIVIHHQTAYNKHHEDEKKAILGILRRGTTPLAPYNKITARIYCKPNLTSSLIMKNSTAPSREKEVESDIVYKFVCADEQCQSPQKCYIRHTTTTL